MRIRNSERHNACIDVRIKVKRLFHPIPYLVIPFLIQKHLYLASEKYSISNGTSFTQKV